MCRKLPNVSARLPIFAGVAFRDHLCFARMISFNPSVKKCFSHSNKRCVVSTPIMCFGSSPQCDYHPNRRVPSTTTGLLRQRNSIMETLNVCQTQVSHVSKLYACSTIRRFSSQSKVHEETKKLDGKDVLEDIQKNIIFMDDDIVAINKPRGLSVFGQPSEKSDRPANTIVGVLPILKEKLNCPELSIGLSLKSFYSGIVILYKHKNSKKQLKNVLAGVHAQKIQFKTYLAITVGVPQCSHGVDITANIKREYLHNKEMSTISDTYVHSAAKEGTMIQTHFSVQPLVVNSSVGAALVRVTINKDKWEAVQVIMSHYLSPVLGDRFYSHMSQLVRGIPFVASALASIPGPQRLPEKMVELLQSKVDCVEKDLPLFAHCHKVVLNRFPTPSSPPMIITAPPHEEFLTTLQCLGLYQDGMFS